MADAGTAAPATGAPQGGEGQTAPAPQNGKTQPTAAQIAKWKADLGDGEQEYDSTHLTELAKRGKKAAQTLSLAEKRAQEAQKREQQAEEREAAFKSGDPKRIRSALKALGVDERTIANEIGRDLLEDMELEKDPVRKQLRDAQRKLQEVEEGKKSDAEKQRQAQEQADVEKHTNELSELFVDVMTRAGLPKSSATAAFPRVASLYAAVEGSGGKVDPDMAATRVRDALTNEHKAMYFQDDGKGGKALNEEAVKALFGPEGLDQLRRLAVREWRAKQAGGQPPPAPPTTPRQPNSQDGEKGNRARNFWRSLESQYK